MGDVRERLQKLLGTDAPCLHVRKSEIQKFFTDNDLPDFTKRTCKILSEAPENEIPPDPPWVRHPVSAQRCDLCAAYGGLFWKPSTSPNDKSPFLNSNEFARGRDFVMGPSHNRDQWRRMLGSFHDPFRRFRQWIFSERPIRVPKAVPESSRFKVVPNQFGEMFHIFFCAIQSATDAGPEEALPEPPRVVINLTDATEEQKRLFKFYSEAFPKKSIVYKKMKGSGDAKSLATQSICAYFWKSEYGDAQEMLFQNIRSFMSTIPFWKTHRNKYVSPDYMAKYWINRYLLLTGQGKLPKLDQNVSRIAVINIRRPSTTETPDTELQSRAEMSSQNLKSTIQAILAANIAAIEENMSPPLVFTHIILYGDFQTLQEATDLVTYTEQTAAQSPIAHPKVLYITAPWGKLTVSPWTPAPAQQTTKRINNCWANFRGDEASLLGGVFDNTPTQVKVINIYTALKLRYSHRICIIGFRSGFLEAAGFLGIPIFYMNETNIDDHPSLDFDDGKMLWHGPTANRIDDRLGKCTQFINSFIAVDVPGPKKTRSEKSKLPKAKQGKKDRSWAGLSSHAVTAQKSQSGSSSSLQSRDLVLNGQGKKQLMAALYMYMLSEHKSGDLLWQRRRELMQNKRAATPSTTSEIESSPPAPPTTTTIASTSIAAPVASSSKTSASSSVLPLPFPSTSTRTLELAQAQADADAEAGAETEAEAEAQKQAHTLITQTNPQNKHATTTAKEQLDEGQILLKQRYERCEALWTAQRGARPDKSSAGYRVRDLLGLK